MTLATLPAWLPPAPVTYRQAERLVVLARELGTEAEDYIWAHLDHLDQNAAYRLIRKLGMRVAAKRREAGEAEKPVFGGRR